MKKNCFILLMLLTLSPLVAQAVNDDDGIADKNLNGLNYYDFYIDYFNGTFKNYQIYDYQMGNEGYVDLNWSIATTYDLNYYYSNPQLNARNCFYDWCLKYVDVNQDKILSADELADVKVIDCTTDPEFLLGRNAVDYHFDWFPNLERLELNHPAWRYLIGDKNHTLRLQKYEIPDFSNSTTISVYFNDIKPFSHLYLPMTGKLQRVVIKNSPMLFFNYQPQEGVPVPEFIIEGEAMGAETGNTFSLNKYVAAGLDISRILSIDNAQVATDDNGNTYLLFDDDAREAHMKYLIATDETNGKQYTVESTIKIHTDEGWTLDAAQVIHEGESVTLDESHFPDNSFRQWLSEYYDSNHDGVMTFDELGNIKRIGILDYSSSFVYAGYTVDCLVGEELLKEVKNFKGIEYLHNLGAVGLGGRFFVSDSSGIINEYKTEHIDLRHNTNLRFFFLGNYTHAIDIKLPEIDGLNEPSQSWPMLSVKFYTDNKSRRVVDLDENRCYDLTEDIENGLDMNRVDVVSGGYIDGNKVVFTDDVVTLRHISCPPIMGGPEKDSHFRVIYYYTTCNFNLIDLINSQTEAITTVNRDNGQVIDVLYYNLQGVSSNEPFKGFNIKVTTYSDGTRTSEKVIR